MRIAADFVSLKAFLFYEVFSSSDSSTCVGRTGSLGHAVDAPPQDSSALLFPEVDGHFLARPRLGPGPEIRPIGIALEG